jgi:uncharacterized protein (TIGR00106 family)
MPVMAEISVIPIGTGGPSVGKLVADALHALAAHPSVRHELGAMGTTLTGELNDVLLACGAMSSAVLAAGAPRCYTIIKLDHRPDKAATAEEKIASVQRHFSGGDAAP